MIRILIADDHTVVRRGIRQILGDESDMKIVAEASTSEEVMTLLRKQPIDLLLLDMTMPDKHGLELLKDIKTEFPKVNILILSMYPEDQFGIRALKAGASGYLTKESDPAILLAAIRKAATGGKYFTPRLTELMELELHHKTSKPLHEILSDREFEVFRLIASGKTVGQIADDLKLSVKTVSNYRTRTLEKMNMKTNSDIMSYAFQNKLVQ
jgi:two-component system, NarL family, invasion response regulator UvrY